MAICNGKSNLLGNPVEVTPITEIRTPEQLILGCYPAFGGAYVRRIYQILDQVIGNGVPLIISIAGPITVSNQHRAWLIPLLETGWVAYITITDAACYHDGHDLLEKFPERPLCEVPISGHDLELRQDGVIRVTNVGFPEDILYKQDRFFSALLQQPEFQCRMTGTEFRNKIGKYYAAQEAEYGISPSLLSTCWKNGIPVFVGSPGDGSAFLNSVKLWVLGKLGVTAEHKFDIDVHAEVFESCAYHHWGITASEARKLAILILGGGVPKNFSLQPEPTLSQIFLLPEIGGYEYDVQIVGAPVTDGSLTSCEPAEAHTWGKVTEEAVKSTTASIQTDYTTVMPLISWALVDKRRRLKNMLKEVGMEELCRRHPEAPGYLRTQGQLRLFEKRDALVQKLMQVIGESDSITRLRETLEFPLALLDRAATT